MSKQGKGRGRGQRRNANEGVNDFSPLGASEANVRVGRGRARNTETPSPGESYPSLTSNEDRSRPALTDKTDSSLDKADPKTISITISPQEKTLSEKKFPKRPGYGTAGKPINLVTNYYTLKSNLDSIYHYDIEINSLDQIKKYGKPVKKRTAAEAAKENISHVEHQMDKNVGKARCLQIFQKLMEIKNLQSFHPVYDGTKNIFTKAPLPSEFSKAQTFTVELEDSGKTRKYEVVMQPADKKTGSNVISVKDLVQKKYDGRSEVIMALNSVLNHRNPPSTQVQIGRSFFFLNQHKKMELGEGLEIWMGYNQSVHLTECGPALVINLSAKAFHKSGPVIEYASDVLRRDIRTQGPMKDYEISKVEEALKKVRVQVTHLKYKRKFYVDGISKRSAKDLKMNINDREVSIADYFKSKYGPLKFPFLPCLFMRSPKNQTYIPLEHCEVLEGQPKLGKLNPALGAKMIKQTAIPPASRFSSIQSSAQDVQKLSGEKMKNYNLLLDLRPLLVTGRVIDSPSLAYFNNSTTNPDNRGVWRIEGKSFLKPPQKINSWVIISFARNSENDLKYLADTLKKTGRDVGLHLEKFGGYKIFTQRDTAEKVLNEIARDSEITFAVIILSRNDRFHNYDEIKFIADYKLGLVTQCMEDKVLGRLNNQIANNICLKINTKLGGVNHALLHKPVVFSKPVIVLGADAVHSPRGMGCPSIAAVVGSMDAYPSKYKVECRVQENEKNKLSQELILEIQDMVKGIFRSFKESTRGKHPEKIIFFRDGVSEGQFKKVRDYEVSAVQIASKDVFGFIIPITFVIVQKRHQTRLRPQNPAQGIGKGGNVPPGTTVDTKIIDPEYFDYFLNSHEGIQGTSKPAHYTVLHDDNEFNADELQKISYHLCYMYSKCNRSISIPAPVMYADLACYRAKKYADFHIQKEGMSVSSDSSCKLPDHVKNAINGMGQFKTSMFFL